MREIEFALQFAWEEEKSLIGGEAEDGDGSEYFIRNTCTPY